jgi:hypothetical protein
MLAMARRWLKSPDDLETSPGGQPFSLLDFVDRSMPSAVRGRLAAGHDSI